MAVLFNAILRLALLAVFILSEKITGFIPWMKRILSEDQRTTAFRLWISIYWVSVALAGILNNVFASSGLVSTIGGATFVQGAGQFWVTSAKPTFSGVTTAGSAVTGTVGSQSVTATADASGSWSWTPATDLTGENPVSITSGSSTAAFTLTIGELPADIASASASTLEPAGTVTNTIAIIGIGTLLISLGSFGLVKTFRKN